MKLKKLLGIVVLGLLLSGNAYSNLSQKQIESYQVEMNNLYEDPGSIAVRKALEEMMRARPGPRLKSFAPQIGMA